MGVGSACRFYGWGCCLPSRRYTQRQVREAMEQKAMEMEQKAAAAAAKADEKRGREKTKTAAAAAAQAAAAAARTERQRLDDISSRVRRSKYWCDCGCPVHKERCLIRGSYGEVM